MLEHYNLKNLKRKRLWLVKHVPKKHVIGEAGSGHTFTSEAEGPISFTIGGENLPLFKRTIFAEQVGENIISEAVDRGYAMLFNKEGVTLYPKDVKVRGAAILFGKRDLTNNLFYIDLPAVPGNPIKSQPPRYEFKGISSQANARRRSQQFS